MKLSYFTFVFICVTSTVYADSPSFKSPFLVEVGGDVLQTEKPHYASPTMVDLDKDGLQDLVVGQFKNGSMIFLKNSGEAGKPEFKSKAWILSGESTATVPGVW